MPKHHCMDCQGFRNLVAFPLPSSIYRLCKSCLKARQDREKKDPQGYKKAIQTFTGPQEN